MYKNTHSFKDLDIFLKDWGHISILGIKIKTPEAFFLLQISLPVAVIISFAALGLLLAKNFILHGSAAALIIYFILPAIVRAKISLKAANVLYCLPDVIDMMASLINAGLSVDEAMAYIGQNLDNAVSGLFKVYHLAIFEGSTKKEAFDKICRMSFCSEFKSFIRIIHQAETMGNPIREILRDLSKVYRNNERDLLKMKAEKLESKLIIVIFIFIFIPMLAIFLIPVLPQLKIFIG
ncbi:MAG: hypothetical protein FJW68_02850 [Actinobacteria bacterium]|nr:hypothetical protein [Actinomycetota bacterium]